MARQRAGLRRAAQPTAPGGLQGAGPSASGRGRGAQRDVSPWKESGHEGTQGQTCARTHGHRKTVPATGKNRHAETRAANAHTRPQLSSCTHQPRIHGTRAETEPGTRLRVTSGWVHLQPPTPRPLMRERKYTDTRTLRSMCRQTDTRTHSLAKTDLLACFAQTRPAHHKCTHHHPPPRRAAPSPTPPLGEGSSGHPPLRRPWIQEPQHQGPPGKGRHKPQPLPNTQPEVREEPGPGRACLPTHWRQTPSQRRRQPGLRRSLQNHPGPSGVSHTVPAPRPPPRRGPPQAPWALLTFLLNSGSAMPSCETLAKLLHCSALHFPGKGDQWERVLNT